jgi:pyruvate/2-oxoglutarate dehydrogenase complex dihydrolipoamide dehydrogenase (E3) component
MKSYDFLVIGGGSAGYNAARVAHNLGKRVAIVDGAKTLGGLCMLQGCMPSKTLIYVAEVLHLAKTSKKLGLKIPHASANMKVVAARKKQIIAEFADYREKQLTSGKYDLYRSMARFINVQTVELADGTRLSAKKILIATGSKVSTPPIPGIADVPSWTSDEVLDLDFIPESVIVLGGGIVACELAQFLGRIGTRVTVVQRGKQILRDHSEEASDVVKQAFADENIKLFTDTQILAVAGDSKGVSVKFRVGGKTTTKRARYLFNALGRSPNSANLGLHEIGVARSETGRVITNRFQQTTIPHIYAAGDVSGPHDIVHLAVAQGELVANHAFGKKVKPIDDALLLNVVFTDPQIGTIGAVERDLKKRGIPYLSASYPFNDHGKSILMEANYGYVKVLAEPKRGRILGAEIVGKEAGDLIHCFSGPLAMKATVFDLLRAPWYHPTLAEIVTYPLEEIADQIKK